MQKMKQWAIIILMAVFVVALSGCMGTKLNTDTPIRVQVGTLTSQVTHNVIITLFDTNGKQTTADGIVEVSIFKGKFADNDASQVNQFVLSQKYGAKGSDFKETEVLFRDIKKTELAWTAKLPDTFKPELADLYKINVYFKDNATGQTLGNSTYIVWG